MATNNRTPLNNETAEVKGRIREDGLIAKMDFARICARNGMTRPQTVHALITKYPTMAFSYAKSIVYSYMADDAVKFKEARRGRPRRQYGPEKPVSANSRPKKQSGESDIEIK